MGRSSFLTTTSSSSSRVQTDKDESRLTLSSLEREYEEELSVEAESSLALHKSSISTMAGTSLEAPCPKIGKSDQEKVDSVEDSALQDEV